MATLADIKNSDWSLSITKPGEIVEGLADINQCIHIILTTVPGSDPLRPDFGCGIYEFIDKPVNIAIPNMRRAIRDALKKYEPRVKLTKIEHTLEESHITFKIIWTLNRQTVSSNTISYAFAA